MNGRLSKIRMLCTGCFILNGIVGKSLLPSNKAYQKIKKFLFPAVFVHILSFFMAKSVIDKAEQCTRKNSYFENWIDWIKTTHLHCRNCY